MSEIRLKLQTPRVPNFIIVETPPGKRQDGFKEAVTISIADLSDEVLSQIADEWKAELLKAAKLKRDTNWAAT